MTKIKNLTGHIIRVYNTITEEAIEIEPEVYRCEAVFYSLYRIDPISGIRFEYRVNNPIIKNLPPMEEDTVFVVSSTIASAVLKNQELYGNRTDLYVPKGKVVKDQNSKQRVNHCKSLSQIL